MNRFHLLSLAEDGDTVSGRSPVVTTFLPTPPEVSPTKQPHASKAKSTQESKPDRRPRGARRDEGEKHQVATEKGPASRSLDAGVIETEGEPKAVEGETTTTQPRPVYKTVKQFLVEKEEHQRRLQSINSTVNPRQPNEGSEGVDAMEVIKKSNEIFTVGATVARKGISSNSTQKGNSVIRMTLQELNKAVPIATSRRPASANNQHRLPQNERDQRSRSKNGDENKTRQDTRRGFGERRPLQRQHQSRSVGINLKDEVAFPCLV